MKIKILIIILLINCYNAYSETDDSPFDINRYIYFCGSLGSVGMGYNMGMSEASEYDKLEINLSVLSHFLELWIYDKPRIELEFCPLNFRWLPFAKHSEISFVNIKFSTDILPKNKSHSFSLGPFAGLNWIMFDGTGFSINNYLFSCGLRFVLWGGSEGIKIQAVDLETGYRYKNEKHYFYATIKFDFFDILFYPVIYPIIIEDIGDMFSGK